MNRRESAEPCCFRQNRKPESLIGFLNIRSSTQAAFQNGMPAKGAVLMCLFAEVAGADKLGSAFRFFVGVCMTTELLRHRLEHLGWKVLREGRHENGRWCVLAASCGHFIAALANDRTEAWSASCAMAMKLTREGVLRLPRL